jgi:hypothetical protein
LQQEKRPRRKRLKGVDILQHRAAFAMQSLRGAALE